jgi:DNA-directed RNA polymerase specialized sigma24 family protein
MMRAELERLVGELRPKLHRYCARMTGSAVDGEDIVQDALIEALAALPNLGVIDNPEAGSSVSPTTRRSISCAAARAAQWKAQF